MSVSETQNFARKFILLCQEGISAKLQARTHAGKVWVSLTAELGIEKKSSPKMSRHHGPSRERRRQRRAQARADLAAAQAGGLPVNEDAAEEADVLHPTNDDKADQATVFQPTQDVAVQTASISTSHAAVQASLHPNQSDATVQAALKPKQSDAAVEAALQPNHTDAAVQVCLHPNQAEVHVQAPLQPNHAGAADAAVHAEAPSLSFSRTAVHSIVSQPNPVPVGQRVHVHDAVCHDPTFNRLVQEAKIREMELARLERNRGFGFNPRNQRRPF